MKGAHLVPGRRYTIPGHLSKRAGKDKVFEFSRIGGTGLAIIHEPGEPDMQSSLAVDPDTLVPVDP